MNLQGKDRLRKLLMGAVAVGVLGPQVVRSAGPAQSLSNQTPAKAVTRPAPAPPRLLPAPGSEVIILPVSQQVTPASSKKSEVMKQLELLYQQDGREMPEMNTDIRPVPTDGAPATAPANTSAAPAQTAPAQTTQARTAPAAQASPNGLRMQQPSRAQKAAPAEVEQSYPAPASPPPAPEVKSKNPVVAFFKKLFPHKSKPGDYRPDVAPIPPAQMPPAAVAIKPIEPGVPLLDSQPRSPFVSPEVVPDPLPRPLADVSDIPPAPGGTLPVQTALVPPLFTEPVPAKTATQADAKTAKKTATEPANPFTELSEAEADKKLELNPFTGLTLDENAASAKAAGEPKVSAADAPPSAENPNNNDPFADELEKLGLKAPGTQSNPEQEPKSEKEPTPAPKLGAPAVQPPTFDGIEDQSTREKMKKIHERGGMKGLKGFCPVTLRDQRELKDAKPEFHSTFRGQKFHFADAEAKIKFDEEPARYAPAAYGADVVALTRDKDVVEGSLDFAAWFKGRLYLFGTEEAHDTFVSNPAMYATPVGIE